MYSWTDMGHSFRITGLYTAFDEWIESDYFFAGERHNFWELVYVAQGQVGITAGEDARVLKAGEGVLHSPMEFHRVWYAGTPGQIMVLSFRAEGMPAGAAGGFRIQETERLPGLLEQVRQAFVLDGITVAGLGDSDVEAQLVLKAWELLLLELLRQKTPAQREQKSRPARNYAAIVRVLEENLHRNLSVEQIAGLCSMSPVSVKQTFSRYAGMGVMNYFNRRKIQAAASMLREGASVQETASALGFSSQNYFCTVFKRVMGISPTQYKRGEQS